MELSRRYVFGLTAAALATSSMGRASAQPQDATPASTDSSFTIYLLTIRGSLAPATLEDARALHNQTAGDPASIAAARSLGDVSHMIYLPQTPATSAAGDVLFMDLWTSIEGLNQFFANPQVQSQASEIFTARDPVVWAPATGLLTYHLPAPFGQQVRVVTLTRGVVESLAGSLEAHNAIITSQINNARLSGSLSHEAYFRLAAPDAPESREFLAVDTWLGATDMEQFYAQPEVERSIQTLFVAPPDLSIWTQPAEEWTEW